MIAVVGFDYLHCSIPISLGNLYEAREVIPRRPPYLRLRRFLQLDVPVSSCCGSVANGSAPFN
jgi:hypothetical protein